MGKYNKEDLLWEAVRRNEEFKSFFKNELENYSKDPENPLFDDTKRIFIFPRSQRWHMTYLPDPNLDIKTIKKQMKLAKDRNENSEKLHPYMDLYRTKPVIYYSYLGLNDEGIKKYLKQDQDIEFQQLEIDQQNVCIRKKNLLINELTDEGYRIIFSIDPQANEALLFKAISSLKKVIKDQIAKKNRSKEERIRIAGLVRSKKDSNLYINSNDIESYIRWLRDYDRVISKYIQSSNVPLNIQRGAILVSSEFKLKEGLPDKYKRSFESELRLLRKAYKGAVSLIQAAPNLYFYSSKSKTSKK